MRNCSEPQNRQNHREEMMFSQLWCLQKEVWMFRAFYCEKRKLPFRSKKSLAPWRVVLSYEFLDHEANIPYIDGVIFFVKDGFLKAHEFLWLKFLTYLFLYHQKLFLTCSMGLEHFTCIYPYCSPC